MKAFVEHLSGIIRIGPDTEKYGDSFEYAVAYCSTDGKTAVLKALVGNSKFTRAHARAAIQALAQIGLKAVWSRKVDNPGFRTIEAQAPTGITSDQE